jgi:phage terminase Nu1 subunit (DNA packaging protein)
MSKKQFTVNQQEAAFLLAVDCRTIQTWSKRSTDPLPVARHGARGQPNEYNPAMLVQWYVRNELDKLNINDGELLDLNTERAKLAKLQARKIELDLEVIEGRMVDTEQAGAALEKVIMACRSRLLAMPSKIAPQVFGTRTLPGTAEAIREGVYDALTELSQMDVEKVISTEH